MSLFAVLPASSGASAAEDVPVEFITLGTGGGPVVQTRRAQPANALTVGEDIYLFDVGEGTQRQMAAAGLPLGRVKAVFLTHHHLDHVGGLAPLLVNRWVQMHHQPLPVVGPPGTAEMASKLAEAFRPTELAPVIVGDTSLPPIARTVVAHDIHADLDKPAAVYEDANVRVTAVENDHYHFASGSPSARHARSYSFRIEIGARRIVLTGDTGPSPRLDALAKGADLLVSEVMDRPAIERELRRSGFSEPALKGFLAHMDKNHLTPDQVGETAARADVGTVILTHLVPGRDVDANDAGYVQNISDRYHGTVVVAKDLDRFSVPIKSQPQFAP